jgi:hypothetical protein
VTAIRDVPRPVGRFGALRVVGLLLRPSPDALDHAPHQRRHRRQEQHGDDHAGHHATGPAGTAGPGRHRRRHDDVGRDRSLRGVGAHGRRDG